MSDENGVGWTTGPFTIYYQWLWTADAGSGLYEVDSSVWPSLWSVAYKVDDGAWQYLTFYHLYPDMSPDQSWWEEAQLWGTPMYTFDTEGVHTFCWNATDLAGNVEATHELMFGIDNTPPEVELTLDGTEGQNGWWLSDVRITAQASDALSGLSLSAFYKIDNGPIVYVPADDFYYSPLQVLITGDGHHTFTAWFYDNAGFEGYPSAGVPTTANEWHDSIDIWIDTTAPETLIGGSDNHFGMSDENGVGWTTGPFTIYYQWLWTADAGSGLYEVDSSVWPSLWSVAYKVDDGAWQYLTFYHLYPDMSPDQSWWEEAQLWGTPMYTFDTEGVHTFCWNATDLAGNVEATHELMFGIDNTPPEVNLLQEGSEGQNGWWLSDVMVTVEASDVLSGLSSQDVFSWHFYYQIDDGPIKYLDVWDNDPFPQFLIAGDGHHTFTAWVYDNAGWEGYPPDGVPATANEWHGSIDIWIDKTPPTITVSFDRPPDTNGWYISEVSVTINVSDWLSGLYGGEYLVLDEAGTFDASDNFPSGVMTFETTITIPVDGVIYIAIPSVSDSADNFAEPYLIAIYIDWTPPETSASLDRPPNYNGWYRSDVTVILSAIDDGSGVAETRYSLDGVNWVLYSGPFAFSEEGISHLLYRSTDSSGNAEVTKEIEIKLDKTPPTTTVTFDRLPDVNGWYTSEVSVTINVSDWVSGLYGGEYLVLDEAGTFDASDNFPSGVMTFETTITIPVDGVIYIAIPSVSDSADNFAEPYLIAIYIDWTPPETTASPDRPSNYNGWYQSDVTVTLSATDYGSGLAETRYSLDGVNWILYSGPFAVSEEGISHLLYRSTDSSGNTEVAKEIEIKLDKTPPAVTVTFDRLPDVNGWYTSEVSVTINVSDWVSGIYEGDYFLLDEAGTYDLHDFLPSGVMTFETTITIPVDGVIYIAIPFAADQAGNFPQDYLTAIYIDWTPPETEISVVGDFENENFLFGKATVTLMPTDPLSGVSETFYSLNGETWTPYSGPFNIYTEGENIVQYYSIDAVGNKETAKSYPFILDTTPPEVDLQLSGTLGTNGWFTSEVTVTATVTDAVSGVLLASFSVVDNEGTLNHFEEVTSAGNSYVFTFTISVESGNLQVIVDAYDYSGQEDYESVSLRIDMTPPETTITLDRSPDSNGWYSADVTVTLSASDMGSGVATTEYRYGSMPWTTYTGPFTISEEDTHTLLFNSTDVSGNVELTKEYEIKIDKTAPESTLTPSGIVGNDDWFISAVSLNLVADDGTGAGVASIYYILDSGAITLYTDTITVPDDGYHTIEYWSEDAAGNIESPHGQYEFKIDTTAPETKIDYYGYSHGWWYEAPVELSFPATDETSGVALTEYSLDEVTWFTYSGTFFFYEDGDHHFYFRSTDFAGNVEETEELPTLKVDGTAPSCIINFDGTLGDNGWFVSDVLVTVSLSDELSGVGVVYVDFEDWPEPQIYEFLGTPNAEITFTVSKEDIDILWRVTYFDVTGNSAESGGFLDIDKTPPETKLTYVQEPGVGSTVTLSAVDSLSGQASTMYSIDGTIWETYDAPFTLSSGGIVDVHFYSIDAAGNVEEENVEPVEVDILPPVSTYEIDGILGLEGWYVSNVNITLDASDDIMGVDVIAYSYDEIVWTDYNGKFEISGEGLTTIYFNATDKVGNMELTQIIEIYIDKTAPITNLIIGTPSFGLNPTYVSTTTEFTLEAIDTSSGIDRIEYRIDLGIWVQYTIPFTIPDIGGHTISYRSFDVAGNEGDTQFLSVVVSSAGIIYSGDISGNYSDPVVLEAQLIDLATQLPLEGKTISFVLGTQTISTVTGPDGIASAIIILDQAPGVYTLFVTFEPEGVYPGCSTEVEFVIEKEQATATYTGSTVVSSLLETFTMRATILDDDDGYWGDLTRIHVTFIIYNTEMDIYNPILVTGPVSVEATDVDGVGVAVLDVANLPLGSYLVVVRFDVDGNDYYQGLDSDTVTLTIYESSGDFVTGGGWIWDSEGHKGHFGFVVKYMKDGTLRGCFLYVYRDGDWLVIVTATDWIGMAIIDNHAYFEAHCSIMQFNLRTWEVIWHNEGYTLKVDAWDNGCNGDDVFQLRIYDTYGLVWHEAGFNPFGYLEGGNIRIHRSDN